MCTANLETADFKALMVVASKPHLGPGSSLLTTVISNKLDWFVCEIIHLKYIKYSALFLEITKSLTHIKVVITIVFV